MKLLELAPTQQAYVVYQATGVSPTETNIQDCLNEIHEYLVHTSEKTVLIFDLSNAKFMSADQRIRIARWFNDHRDLFNKKTLGIALVNPSLINSVILKSVYFLTGDNCATLFSRLDSAKKFAQEILTKKKAA